MIERDSSYITAVKILDVEKRYRPGSKHYVYVIQVTWTQPTNTFVIYRRYAQFFDLQCKLLDLFAEAPTPTNQLKSQYRQIPFLPGKIIFGRSQIREVALERKHALNIYCQTLVSLPEQISRSRPVLEFFRPSADDVKNPFQSPSQPRKPVTKASIAISQPAHLPTYRCIEDFTAVDKIELSLKRKTLVQVIQKHLNGWWFVQCGDRRGFVAGAYLEPVNDREQRTNSVPSVPAGQYLVNQHYLATGPDEISLEKGSFVTVLEKSYTGWWLVQFRGRNGHFPAVYLTSCEGRILPQPSSRPTSIVVQQEPVVMSTDDDDDDTEGHEMETVQTEIFYVHTAYHDAVGDCVSLSEGEAIEIHHQHDSGWWLGRKLNSNEVALSWIPSAFLQRDPLPPPLPPPPPSLPVHLENTDSVKSIPADNIYQNIGQLTSTEVIETMSKPPIKMEREPVARPPSPSPPISRTEDNNECLPNRVSVRDLVKKFNRPSM